MEYFKYTLQFLNTITFTSSTYTELDNFLNGVVKGYLNHNFGFLPIAPTEDELDELADEIGASYDLMLNDIKPRYEEVLRLGTVHTFRSKDTTKSEYGAEDRTGKYYEPVVSSAQAEVKTTGENTTWGDDTTTLDREEDRVLSESAIKDFFKEIKEEVELYFIDFVNIYADGTGCQKPYTLEQLEAINSGATKTKIEQIQTNKENIDLLVDAVAGITDALDDKQDKLNATQLDAVNSGIDATKVAQIETNKNNIAQLSNPNLLINGDFRVNQRGLTTYNALNSYTVDRWKLTGGAGEVVVNSNGTITLNVLNSTTTARILQYIEDTQSLLGKTVTFTIKTSNATYSTTATLPTTLPNANTDYGDKGTGNIGRLKISYISSLQMFCFKIEAFAGGTYDNTVTLEYAKVEIGSVATPFSPRPYAEELAMCQRYYQKINNTAFIYFPRSSTEIRTTLMYSTEMRTNPTITQENLLSVFDMVDFTQITQSSMNIDVPAGHKNNKGSLLYFRNFTGLIIGRPYFPNNVNVVFSLDAEIY